LTGKDVDASCKYDFRLITIDGTTGNKVNDCSTVSHTKSTRGYNSRLDIYALVFLIEEHCYATSCLCQSLCMYCSKSDHEQGSVV